MEAALEARLAWPAPSTEFEHFAAAVFELMVICHSVSSGDVGLTGGKTIAKALHSETPPAGIQRESSVPGCRYARLHRLSTKQPGPYIVQHATRHFLIAADRLGVFNYDRITYSDISPYVPDVGGHCERIADETLATIRDRGSSHGLPASCQCGLESSAN